jgi:PIN domain nuclease of toxin-antitoxin system
MTTLLLDTHVALWWYQENSRLKSTVREAVGIADAVYVSAASAWEVAIKLALRQLRLPASFDEGVEASGFERLPITFAHAERAGALPLHHRDPFDRMLIAQAQVEGLTLVTRDRQLIAYDVAIFPA